MEPHRPLVGDDGVATLHVTGGDNFRISGNVVAVDGEWIWFKPYDGQGRITVPLSDFMRWEDIKA
jgi:hypothetical protein